MNKELQINVNPSVLAWARKSLEYDPKYVAQELEMDYEDFKKLEKGTTKPTYEQLLQMSQIYKRPLAALLVTEVPEEKPRPKDFRTVRSDELDNFQDKTLLAIRRTRGLVAAAIALRKELGISFPAWIHTASLKDDAEKCAGIYRKLFKVSSINKFENTDDALDFLIAEFEKYGILVFQVTLTQDEVRGFSLTDEQVPVIVIRRGGEQATAKIFTLFHELGHILLHEGGICNLKENSGAPQIEKWCNQFAAEALVPIKELLAEKNVRDQAKAGNKFWATTTLVSIGKGWHVGPEVILRKLFSEGLTTKKFYEEKHKKWLSQKPFGRGGGSRDRVKEKVIEKGKTFVHLAVKAYDEKKITLKDFVDYLDIPVDQIGRIKEYL